MNSLSSSKTQDCLVMVLWLLPNQIVPSEPVSILFDPSLLLAIPHYSKLLVRKRAWVEAINSFICWQIKFIFTVNSGETRHRWYMYTITVPYCLEECDFTVTHSSTIRAKKPCISNLLAFITLVFIFRPLNSVIRDTSNQRSCNQNFQWPYMKVVCLIKLIEGSYLILLFHVT